MLPGVVVRAAMLAAVLGPLGPGGCRRPASPERVDAWKATPEGRERLVATLRDRDGRVAVPVRARAAAALTEVGWVDRVESAVAGTSYDERARLIPAVASQVARLVDAADASRAWDARDVLMALRRHATTEEAIRSIDVVLLPALERDLRANRLEGGRHSLKEMLSALGPVATPLVTRVMADEKAPFATAVELLAKVGDQASREAGGAALVRRARGLTTVPPELWQGVSTLGGPQAVAFLEEVVDRRAEDARDAQLHAAGALAKIRLEPSLLPFAVRIAKDPGVRLAVREQMLTLLQRIGSEDARKGMIEIIASNPEPEFRYKTFAAIVAAGSGRQLLPALEAFPISEAYRPDELRTRLVEPIVHVGYSGRPDVLKALESRSPLVRLVALWALEKSAFAADAKQVEKLLGDRGKVKGLPSGATVGAEATRIATYLKKQST
jgi:hypothetical protein